MALQHPGNTAMERQHDGVYEADEGVVLHENDLRPPVLALAQDQSGAGTPGMFFRRDTEQEYESLEVVPLRVQAIRTYWGDGGFDRERIPLCFSNDAVRAATSRADGQPTKFPGQRCMNCDLRATRPWEQKSEDGWCVQGYVALVMDVSTFEVFIMRLNGTSARFGRVFGAKGAIRTAVMRLTSNRVNSNRGTFYAMQAKTVRQMDEGERDVVHGLFEEFAGMAMSATDDERERGAQGGQGEQGKGDRFELLADPEMRYTPSGKAVTSVMAIRGKEIEDAVRLVAWEELAEKLARECKSGDLLLVIPGREKWNEWAGPDGTAKRVLEVTIRNYAIAPRANQPSPQPSAPAFDDTPYPGDSDGPDDTGDEEGIPQELPW